jgi:hypothetical protein
LELSLRDKVDVLIQIKIFVTVHGFLKNHIIFWVTVHVQKKKSYALKWRQQISILPSGLRPFRACFSRQFLRIGRCPTLLLDALSGLRKFFSYA